MTDRQGRVVSIGVDAILSAIIALSVAWITVHGQQPNVDDRVRAIVRDELNAWQSADEITHRLQIAQLQSDVKSLRAVDQKSMDWHQAADLERQRLKFMIEQIRQEISR